jgi:hypothetical protein
MYGPRGERPGEQGETADRAVNSDVTRIVPSAEWRSEERMSFAASLAAQLSELANTSHFVDRRTVFDVSDRIQLVLTQSPTFLEANRQVIIEGKTPNPTE